LWEFVQIFERWRMGNEKPGGKGQDYAIWRRIKMVPFTVTFAEDARDLRLKEKLLKEAEGIVAWAVKGCLEWQRIGGLAVPAVIEQATLEHKEEMDVVGQYLRECTRRDVEVVVRLRNYYTSYVAWCKASGRMPLNDKNFGKQLSGRAGLTRLPHKKDGAHYKGRSFRNWEHPKDDLDHSPERDEED